jgi:hypothetical protein
MWVTHLRVSASLIRGVICILSRMLLPIYRLLENDIFKLRLPTYAPPAHISSTYQIVGYLGDASPLSSLLYSRSTSTHNLSPSVLTSIQPF